MDIAIIGTGASGISVLRELIKHVTTEQTLTVYSSEDLLGTGLPYQKDDTSLLLNQTAETMSWNPDNPHEFVDWLKENKGIENPVGAFFPRVWYGEYLQKMLAGLLGHPQVRLIKQEVMDVDVTADRRFVITTQQEERIYNRVHLAIGHLAYQDPYGLQGTDGYIHVPYPVLEKLKGIDKYHHIGILGTGLTAIDILLYIKKVDPQASVSLFSPSGKFPSVRGDEKEIELTYFNKQHIEAEIAKHNGWLPFDLIKAWFIAECEKHTVDLSYCWSELGKGTVAGITTDFDNLHELGKFQSIIHSMTPVFALLWGALTNEDRKLFLDEYEDQFTQFRSPMPAQTAQKILKYFQDDSTRIYSGIDAIEKESDGFKLSADDGVHTVDILVNGTGQQMDLLTNIDNQPPLVQQLINRRVVQAHPLGGVVILYPSMSTLSPKYGQLDSLKIYGQMVAGVDTMNNTVSLISKSAALGVNDSLQDTNDRE